jgi:hypothetical protein
MADFLVLILRLLARPLTSRADFLLRVLIVSIMCRGTPDLTRNIRIRDIHDLVQRTVRVFARRIEATGEGATGMTGSTGEVLTGAGERSSIPFRIGLA